jgi:hypothetical protein
MTSKAAPANERLLVSAVLSGIGAASAPPTTATFSSPPEMDYQVNLNVVIKRP